MLINLQAPAAISGDNLRMHNESISIGEAGRIQIIDIEIFGNRHTKTYIILRELKNKPGHTATIENIEADRKRIQNLGLFTRVEATARQAAKGIVLQYIVTEKWHIFPYPIFFRNDRSWKKLSYGFGLSYYNFRGRNESLSNDCWFGYNPTLSMGYKNPWFGGKLRLYTSLSIYKKTVKNKSLLAENFNEKKMGVAYTLGKRFGFHTFLDFGLTYTDLTTTASEAIYTLNESGKDRWLTYQLNFRYDTRDLYEYPHKGLNLKAYIQKAGQKNNVINYSRYGADFRTYLPLADSWTLALRSVCDLSRGKIPIYHHWYLGYGERIRGYFHDKCEGENRLLAGAALRFPLRKITYHTIFQDTPFREYYRNLKFGVSAELFIDSGMVWQQREEWDSSKLLTGFGAGIHFHLPYVYLLRIEYGFNEQGRGQWILFDAGVPF